MSSSSGEFRTSLYGNYYKAYAATFNKDTTKPIKSTNKILPKCYSCSWTPNNYKIEALQDKIKTKK